MCPISLMNGQLDTRGDRHAFRTSCDRKIIAEAGELVCQVLAIGERDSGEWLLCQGRGAFGNSACAN